jgi:hypothetical protein
MKKILVKKEDIRRKIQEMLANPEIGWQTTGDLSTSPVSISPVVDPSAAVTNPNNPKFVPTDRRELMAAIPPLVDEISDDDVLDFFDSMREKIRSIKDNEEKMNNKKVEEVIRSAVRKMIREAAGGYKDTGLSYSGSGTSASDEEAIERAVLNTMKKFNVQKIKSKPLDFLKELIPRISSLPGDRLASVSAAIDIVERMDEEASDALSKALKNNPEIIPKKNMMLADVPYEEVAQEMGYSGPPGARAAELRGFEKFARRSTKGSKNDFSGIDPMTDLVVYLAIEDYIDLLEKKGKTIFDGTDLFNEADIQMLKRTPELVRELVTFQVFVQPYVDNLDEFEEDPESSSARNAAKSKGEKELVKQLEKYKSEYKKGQESEFDVIEDE